jgi:hypothetical protein
VTRKPAAPDPITQAVADRQAQIDAWRQEQIADLDRIIRDVPEPEQEPDGG